ncbi:MAG: DNA repair protein RecN [Pseudomonadota bacterium]|nr:DNA repair protein RecN [Pseudomonadota bacterium]
MLHRLSIGDFVIVDALELELGSGLTVLTGETGAGKSILVDALQLALGGRGDAGVVREGAARTDISAEFDTPAALADWLAEAGFDSASEDDANRLLLRRSIDAQGKSRAWINGSVATVAQLRAAAELLVDIHGQHAWQGLTRAPSVRALLDTYARLDARPLAVLWSVWRAAVQALASASGKQADLERERERLAWQIGEIDKLAPGNDEWTALDAEHTRLANGQTLIDAARAALEAVSGDDDGDASNAESLVGRAVDALQGVSSFDPGLAETIDGLRGAQLQLRDTAHTLAGYLDRAELDPARLGALDARLSAWIGLARRYRRPPAELPALLAEWRSELRELDAAADLDTLQSAVEAASAAYQAEATRIGTGRRAAAPRLGAAVSRAMQQLGMAGGRFEVALEPTDAPQSFGLESAEFLVAGHAGTTPRPLGKVASGGELSRIALAVAVVTTELDIGSDAAGTLIFDEVDAGIGGAVAETVGRLMKQIGRDRQVLAVTHLPQVAACADRHIVVAKDTHGGTTRSAVAAVIGEARTAEIARMLGGEKLSSTSLAHAQEMLTSGSSAPATAKARRTKGAS